MNVKKYNVIGIMSGTSCDGLDIALTSFWYSKNKWNYNLISTSEICLLYTSPSPRDLSTSRMPSSA